MRFYFCTEREKSPDTFSRLIQEVSKTNYSHVQIVVTDIPDLVRRRLALPDGDLIFDATTPNYRMTTVAEEFSDPNNERVHTIEIPVWDEVGALGWLMGNVGKDYSLSQCIGYFSTNLQAIWGNGEGKGICVEFGVRFISGWGKKPEVLAGKNLDYIELPVGVLIATEHLNLCLLEA